MYTKESDPSSVVSFDKNKIRIESEGEAMLVVSKLTTKDEVIQLLKMRQALNRRRGAYLDSTGNEYDIYTPRIISWNEPTLKMEFFHGDNLELLLRNTFGEERKKLVEFTGSFFNWMQTNGILWHDAAPRNIIINNSSQLVCLVDFERGFVESDTPFETNEFKRNIRGLIVEEFSALLFLD